MRILRSLVTLITFFCSSSFLSGQSPVEYFLTDQLICSNDTLSLPLQTRDFINVRNFQSSIRWNIEDLSFQSLVEIHPLLADNFLINTDSIETGGLGYFWLDTTAGDPLVLPDSTVLFVLKFIISNGTDMSTIDFGEVPTLTETVVETNGVPVQVGSEQIPGLITINEITAESEIQSVTQTNNGAIDLTILTGQGPFSFLWNTGATTEDLENLIPGDYSVIITDVTGCMGIFSFLVENITSTDDVFNNQLIIQPNPTQDFFRINFMETNWHSVYQLKLYDPFGKLILQKDNLNTQINEKVDLQKYPSGLYFLEIISERKKQIFKVIKR